MIIFNYYVSYSYLNNVVLTTLYIPQGNINASRPLPWPLYQEINQWLMEMGTKDGIFGVVYAKLTVNLACRGDNTNTICIKHLLWGDDSLGIPFAHEKAN